MDAVVSYRSRHAPDESYMIANDARSLTLQYCQNKFPVYDDQATDLDVEDLPWDYLPGIYHLSIGHRERGDLCDGHLISGETVDEARAVLQVFIDHCHVAAVDLETHDGFSFEEVPNYAKTCLILQILERQHSLPIFMASGAFDDSYPLNPEIISDIFGVETGSPLVRQFLIEQSRFSTSSWGKGEHVKVSTHQVLPFKSLRQVGHGAQGSVDAVVLVATGARYARKRWRSTNLQANQRFIREIRLLRRLDPQRHIVEIVNTYSRGTEVGIVMTLAEYDLGHVLSMSPQERHTVIPDVDLRKSYGCLSFALSHMHELGIRHKDIKPQNVLVKNSRLLFTDFGTSKDTSELSNSLTTGGTGTRKYFAPEFAVPGSLSHQAPADVFALGLVLLSIWSTLQGWQFDKAQSFSFIAQESPFCENMPAIHEWINGHLEGRIQGPASEVRSPFQKAWDIILLRLLRLMVLDEPSARLKIAEVVAVLCHLSEEACFCHSCQDIVGEEAVENADIDWLMSLVNPTVEKETIEVAGSQLNSIQDCATEESEGESEGAEVASNTSKAEDGDNDSASESDEESGEEDADMVTPNGVNMHTNSETATLPLDPVPKETAAPNGMTPPMAKVHANLKTPTDHSGIGGSLLSNNKSSADAHLIAPQQINFVDCLGRNFACPYHSVKTWEGISKFMKKKFPRNIPQLARVSAQVHANQFDLVGGPKNENIDEEFWEDIVQPGWTVKMHLWNLLAVEEPMGTEEQAELVAALTEEKAARPAATRSDPESPHSQRAHPSPERSASNKSTEDPSATQRATPKAANPPEPEMFTCPVCMVVTGNKETIKHHVNAVHSPAERGGKDESGTSGSESDLSDEPATSNHTASNSSSTKSQSEASSSKKPEKANRRASSRKSKHGIFAHLMANSMRQTRSSNSGTKKGKASTQPRRTS